MKELEATDIQDRIKKIDLALEKANRVSRTIGTGAFSSKFDLSNLPVMEYVDMDIRVGRIKKALNGRAKPTLASMRNIALEDLERSLVQKGALIPTPSSGRELISKTEPKVLLGRLRGMLPDTKLEESELFELAVIVGRFMDGTLIAPNPIDFLEGRESGRAVQIQHAKRTLQGLIALCVVREEKRASKGLKWRLGRETNRLRFLLGVPNGRELISAAFDELSDVERTVLFGAMSTNLKHKFEYPDLGECSEEQMADYIKMAVYLKDMSINKKGKRTRSLSKDEAFYRFEILIDSCIKRMAGGFNLYNLISTMSQNDYFQDMCNRMIEVAYFRGHLDSLECLFQQHPITLEFSKKCRRLRLDEEELELPRWLRET